MSEKELKIKFTNGAPDNEEWSAHIRLLNDWTPDNRKLRTILQYARSGPFHPADMHVDLIQQLVLAAAPKSMTIGQALSEGWLNNEYIAYNQAIDDYMDTIKRITNLGE